MSMSRGSRGVAAVAVGVGCWLLAGVFVRVSLDWSDSQPYAGGVTEARYILFACIAVAIAAFGTIAGVVLWRRRGRR
ncbi:hypothetical protein P0L94_07205 [Microbacter sp. GSS18]|nr:hypothetical protein P0L94_07205 [Microbacter sp. GSS18]